MTTALAISDARLYEAAQALRAGSWRIFWTVTLPGARYGVISAVLVVFVLVITDFGVPEGRSAANTTCSPPTSTSR